MFKKQRKLYIGIILLNFIFISFFTSLVFAEDTPLLIEKDIILKNGCVVKDTNAETHIFPKDDSPSEFLGICVLAEALEQGFISDLKLINDPNLGLYVQSINGIEPGNTEFWGLWRNGEFADCGIGCLPISEGDVLSLVLTDWIAETESAKIIFHITELASPLDTTPPIILLTGSNTINLNVGDTYTELGATATDDIDISVSVIISGSVDTATIGAYTIYYNARDTAGNIAIEVIRTVNVNRASGGGDNGGTTPPSFDIEKAVNYLKSMQDENGSFGDADLYTDWAAVAFGSANVNDSSKSSLLSYLSFHNDLSSLLTDNERRAMALLALGQNPYSFHEENYIEAIIESFDGTQLGDVHLDNDDIFGLIVLPQVGYKKSDEIISKIISFILSAQVSNGSWDNSVDITAAAIQALEPFDSVSSVSEALAEAADYIEGKQNNDGGWGNVFSTSWVIQAESALDASWSKNGKNGIDYLAGEQVTDGAVLPLDETETNRIWATSYAVAATSEKPWSEIMNSVSKPGSENRGNNSSAPALTEPVSIIPATPLPINVAVITPPKFKVVLAKKETKKEIAETPEIIPETLVATAAEALPASSSIPQNLPIALGTASGLILLSVVIKKFLIV